MLEPLRHEADSPDSQRAADADAFLAQHASPQFLVELLGKLRALSLPWWTPEMLRESFPALVRVTWLADRPDVRAKIVESLTGLNVKIARRKSPEEQAAIIDEAIVTEVCTVDQFEMAFAPDILVIYGDAGAFWKLFCEKMDWAANDEGHRNLVAGIITSLLASRGDLPPIMKHLHVRRAIDDHLWQTRLPIEIHIKIERERLEREELDPTMTFLAEDVLQIATPQVMTGSFLLADFLPLFGEAKKALGFDEEVPDGALTNPPPPPDDSASASITLDGDDADDAEEIDLLRDSEVPPSAPEGGGMTLEEQFRAKGARVPGLDMSAVEGTVPLLDDSGVSSAKDLYKKELQGDLRRLGCLISGSVLDDLLVTDLEALKKFLETGTMPEDSAAERSMMSTFLIARTTGQFTREKLDNMELDSLRTQFLGKLIHVNRRRAEELASQWGKKASGAHKPPAPPPLPPEGSHTG
jgi:hypothetical protein